MKQKTWIFMDKVQAELHIVAWAGPVPSLKKWFREGIDVHSNVAQTIAKTIQDNKLKMPNELFTGKHWSLYGKGDEERELSKRTVHTNNYDMGVNKYALVMQLPLEIARMLQNVYHATFPEIRGNYHAWINGMLSKNRTIVTPYGRRRIFYDVAGPELSRSAYAFYPQSTVGDEITIIFNQVRELFSKGLMETDDLDIRKQLWTPSGIKASGMVVRLQVHDALGVCVDNDPVAIRETAMEMKRIAEKVIMIKGEGLVIPVDFKVGPSWGDSIDYKIAA